ncbi:MAG: fumarylacetoacetase, partial [Paracoccaceae bacterium]|nr:fumarylacetoacetase [Paracoccaceae bacterium]
MPLLRSWIESANSAETDFPLNNLPCGVFSTEGAPSCGVAIGAMILDVSRLEADGRLDLPRGNVFADGAWNAFMARGPEAWAAFRTQVT